jgi:hypothetical protein
VIASRSAEKNGPERFLRLIGAFRILCRDSEGSAGEGALGRPALQRLSHARNRRRRAAGRGGLSYRLAFDGGGGSSGQGSVMGARGEGASKRTGGLPCSPRWEAEGTQTVAGGSEYLVTSHRGRA